MGSSERSTLTPLQVDLLSVLTDVPRVYLTGGAALGHYYLQHRGSHDLDWFTPDRAELPALAGRLVGFCDGRGYQIGVEQEYPGFQRFAVTHGDDRTLVDLVHEPVPQTVSIEQKPLFDGVRVDSIEDIVANKLSAVLGRGETKDLVDLLFLERAGHDPMAYLPAARDRDGGMDAATLAWVMGSMPTDPGELLLHQPLTEAQVRAFRDGLVQRLQVAAHPDEGS